MVAPVQLPVRQSLPDGFRLALGIFAMVMILTGLGQFFWRDIRQELDPVLQMTDSVAASEQNL
jgi:type VI secretion system protein ImpK